jgi:hypothetical protein
LVTEINNKVQDFLKINELRNEIKERKNKLDSEFKIKNTKQFKIKHKITDLVLKFNQITSDVYDFLNLHFVRILNEPSEMNTPLPIMNQDLIALVQRIVCNGDPGSNELIHGVSKKVNYIYCFVLI